MQAALLFGPRDIRVTTVPDPVPGPREVVVRTAFCGLCGSDLHRWEGWLAKSGGAASDGENEPRNLGHEISGVVAEIGRDVTRVRVGDQVAINPYIFCGECFFCRNDYTTHCDNRKTYAKGWAEYVLSHESGAYTLPEGVSLQAATQAESLAACLKSVELTDLRSGSVGLVVGAGPMGLMAHALLRHSGAARTIVSEPSALRRDIARAMGADVVVDPTEEALAEVVRRESGGYGADVAIDAVTRSFTLKDAIDSVHAGGTVVVLGNMPATDEFPITLFEMKRKGLTLKGSASRGHHFDRALRWLQRIDVAPLLTHHVKMDELNSAMEMLKDGSAGKVVMTP